MEYKLNLITPSVYSQAGKDNCIDHNVEEFASYVKDRADNEFLLPCKYERVPGSAYIHSFEDFEQRFLIHSEYAVIIASPLSQKALSRFIPRLLVFLTSKPIWQNRFLFVLLGEVQVLSNLVVNDPIQFSINEWETKDEPSWITLFKLIKITWKPHVDEYTILPNAINDSSQTSSLNEQSNTSVNEIQDTPTEFRQSAEVKSSVTRATQGSIVTVENLLFISDDPKPRNKFFNDAGINTDLPQSPCQEWEDNETNNRRIESNFELDNKQANFQYSFLPKDYQEENYADEKNKSKPSGSEQIDPSQTNLYDSNFPDVAFDGQNMEFNRNFKVYSETRATQGPDVTVEDIMIINRDLQTVKNQSCTEIGINTDLGSLTNKYSDENKGAVGGVALLTFNRDLISVESNYDTDNESEGTFECFAPHNDFNDDNFLNENDPETSKEHGLYLIKELDDPATRNFNLMSKTHTTKYEKDNIPTINVLLSTEEVKEPFIQSNLTNTGSSSSNNDGDLHDNKSGDNSYVRERHDFKFSDKNDYLSRNAVENVIIKSDATMQKEEIADKAAFKQRYDIPEINLQGDLLDKGSKKHRDSFSKEKGTLTYLKIKELTDDGNPDGDELNENVKYDDHLSLELSSSQNVSEFDCSNKDPENLETNTNNGEFLDNTLEYSDLVIGNLAESGSNNRIFQTRSKFESTFTSDTQETIDEDDYEQSQLYLDSPFDIHVTATVDRDVTSINASSDSSKMTSVDANMDSKDGGIADQGPGTKDEFIKEMNIETNSKTFYLSDSEVDLSKRGTNKTRESEMVGYSIDKVSEMECGGQQLLITDISTERQIKKRNNEVGAVTGKTADFIIDENVCSLSHISQVDKNVHDVNIDCKSLGTSLNIENISPEYLEEHDGNKMKIGSGFQTNIEKSIVTEQEWEVDLKLCLDSPLEMNPKECVIRKIQNLEKDREVKGRIDLKEFVDESILSSNATNKEHDYADTHVDKTGHNFGNIGLDKDQKDKKEKFIEIGYSELDDDNLRNKLNKEETLAEKIDFKEVVFEIGTDKDDKSDSLYKTLTREDIPSGYSQWHEEIKIPTEFDANRYEDKVKFHIGDKTEILLDRREHNDENTEDKNTTRVTDDEVDLIYREDLSSNVTGHVRGPSKDNVSSLMDYDVRSDQLSVSMITDDLENTICPSLLSKDHEELVDMDNSDNSTLKEIKNMCKEFSGTDKNDNTQEEKRQQEVNEESNEKLQKRQKYKEDQSELENLFIASDRELKIKDSGKEVILDMRDDKEEKHTDDRRTHLVDLQVDFASREKKSVKIDKKVSSMNVGLSSRLVESKVTKDEDEAGFSTDLRDDNKHGNRFKNEMSSKSGSMFDDSNFADETRDNSFVRSSPTEELYVENKDINEKTSRISYNPFSFLSGFRLTRFYFWRNFFSHSPLTTAESEDQLLLGGRKSIAEYFRSPYYVLLLFVAGTLASPYWVAITKRISESPAAPEILTGTIVSSVIHEEAVNRKYFIIPVKSVRSLGVNSSSKLVLKSED